MPSRSVRLVASRALPPDVGVLLHPSRHGRVQRIGLPSRAEDPPGLIDQNRLQTRRSEVEPDRVQQTTTSRQPCTCRLSTTFTCFAVARSKGCASSACEPLAAIDLKNAWSLIINATPREEAGSGGGKFVAPAAYRKGGQPQTEQSSPRPVVTQAQDCPTKGNIANSGERIYHVPDGAFYDRTKMDQSAGERWFCSEQEAQAAGRRRSMR
jgi:hypothetical protein